MKQRVKITTVARACKDGTCPAAHVTGQGMFVFQAYKLDPAILAELGLPEGEDAVGLPLDRARELLKAALEQIGDA